MGLIRLRGVSCHPTKRCRVRYLGVTMPSPPPHVGDRMSDRPLQLAQLEKLLGSRALHGSESLCKLLQYLANHSLEHPGVSPKEYQIATEVFGRQKDFDPHLDSMVRVQAGRLRAKLAEYYASEGVDDHFVLEMPKGSYALTFHQRSRGTGRNHANTSHEAPNSLETSGRTSRAWIVAVIALSVILASAVAVATVRMRRLLFTFSGKAFSPGLRSRGSSSATQPSSAGRTLACATTIVPGIPGP